MHVSHMNTAYIIFIYLTKKPYYAVYTELGRYVSIHGLPGTGGHVNTSYADPCIGLNDEHKVCYNKK